MPPAFVLSQNQTLKLMYDQGAGGIPEAKTGISGSRSCTNSQSGVFAYLRHMSLRAEASFEAKSIRNGINLTDQPEPRGSGRPGRRPHVPSSKPTMSKSRRASSPGSIGSGHRLYRLRRGAKRWPTQDWAAAVAGGAYMGTSQMRQRLFAHPRQKTVSALQKRRPVSQRLHPLDSGSKASFKTQLYEKTAVLQALWM